MSNLLKSKFLLGVVMVVVVVLGGYALTANAQQATVSATDIQYAATVQQGSSGQASLIWQKFLNDYSSANLVADGKFGPLSVAAAKVWQASRSLVADGVLGAMSRASAVAQIGSGVVNPGPGTYPAGCSSNTGYSVTTGMSCAGTSTGTLPAGCTSTMGYSPTTGVKCDSTGTTPDDGGPLAGGAGSVTITSTSSDVESTATENKDDVKVLGFKVEAEDSDVAITNVKVELANTGYADPSSEKLTDYLDVVSVWMGDTNIGEADASDFSRDSGSPDIFSKSIALSNAVVREGDKETFYVAVSSGSVDTDDLDANWNIKVSTLRFEDATGMVLSETVNNDDTLSWTGTGAETFDYESSSANDNLTIKSSSTDPDASTITVDANSNTNGVLIGAFKLEVDEDSSDITLMEIPVIITFGANGTLGAGADWADSVITTLNVEIDGTTYEADLATADDATNAGSGAATYRVDLSDSDVVIDAGDTVDVEISADFNDQSGNYDDLTTVTASVPDNTIDAEGADTLGNSERDGAYSGEAQTLSLVGGSVDVTNITEDGNSNDADDSFEEGTFTFYVTIAAEEGNIDVDAASIVETLLDPAANTVALTLQIVNLDGDATENTPGTDYTVVDGDSNTFSIVYTINPDAAGTYYVRLDSIDGISVDETTEGVNLVAS